MIKIEIKDDTFTPFLKQLRAKLGDLSPLMREIAGVMRGAVEDNFRDQGRPEWKASERAKKQGGKTLQDTGRLAASIGKGTRSNKTEAIVGTNVVYAAVHQFGGSVTIPAHTRTLAFKEKGGFMSRRQAGRRKAGAIRVAFANYAARTFKMPERPFLSMTDADYTKVQAKIQEYLSK